jgi:hypothetical protein
MAQNIISRSDATQLVDFYFHTSDDDTNKDYLRYFKEQCIVSGIFENIVWDNMNSVIVRIYKAIGALDGYMFYKDMVSEGGDYSELNVALPPGEHTMLMLHHAVDNYVYGYNIEKGVIKPNSRGEELADCFIEKNTCAVCQTFRTSAFYFSTVYGLNLPVCSYCIADSDE